MENPVKLRFTLGEIECTQEGAASVTLIADPASASKAHGLLSNSLTGVEITSLEDHAFRLTARLPALKNDAFSADPDRLMALAVDLLTLTSQVTSLDLGMECVPYHLPLQEGGSLTGMSIRLRPGEIPSEAKRKALALLINDRIDDSQLLEDRGIANITGGVHTEFPENNPERYVTCDLVCSNPRAIPAYVIEAVHSELGIPPSRSLGL